MKRNLQLALMALTLMLGTSLTAQNIVGVFGTVTGLNGSIIDVHIETVQGTMPVINHVVQTDANGFFGDTLNLISNTGWVQVWIEDCDSMTVAASAPYTGNAVLNFTLLYCSNVFTDCLGIPNGTNWPGTVCDDGDPNTNNDMWDVNCICAGDSLNSWVDCLGVMNGPDVPGAPCDDNDPNTLYDYWDVNCVCVGDTMAGGWIDCMGVQNGPNLPGTVCDDLDPNTFNDYWDQNCFCVGDSLNNVFDCLGIPNGTNWPGTPCDDNDPNTFNDIWSLNCVCTGDSTNVWIDCNGVVNGLDVPGASCDDNDPNTNNDTWDFNCNCAGVNTNPCDATFGVTQAYDSINGQIPFEVWAFYFNYNVFFTYTWDFGDGTSSTDPFPTHVYSGNGPYLLCLTITGQGCTDTYCDTIELDPNGIIVPGQGSGFTLNIFNANVLGVDDVELIDDISIVPNPVNGPFELVLESKESVSGKVEIIDLTGRVLSSKELRIQSGANRISMDSTELNAGTYLIRLTYGDKAIVSTIVAQ